MRQKPHVLSGVVLFAVLGCGSGLGPGPGSGPESSGSTVESDSDASSGSGVGSDDSTDPTASESGFGGPAAEIAPFCGDGAVDPGEKCDDPLRSDCINCIRDRLVFISSKAVSGDFGSMPGIDDFCNQLAGKAGLLPDNKKRFKPWVSTTYQDAKDRFYHSPGRYVLTRRAADPDVVVFAQSWDDILVGNILHPLNRNEYGDQRDDHVWTGTLPDGTGVPGSTHCDDWTYYGLAMEAYLGASWLIDSQWTYATESGSPAYCGGLAALYCFEYR